MFLNSPPKNNHLYVIQNQYAVIFLYICIYSTYSTCVYKKILLLALYVDLFYNHTDCKAGEIYFKIGMHMIYIPNHSSFYIWDYLSVSDSIGYLIVHAYLPIL